MNDDYTNPNRVDQPEDEYKDDFSGCCLTAIFIMIIITALAGLTLFMQ